MIRNGGNMKKQLSTLLSICILGKRCVPELQDCIQYAAELTPKVFFIDLGLAADDIGRIEELGTPVVNLDSFPSEIETDWVLFIKPEERVILSSAKKLAHMLMSKQVSGYGVHTKTTDSRHLLEDFQWIKQLEQFKAIGNSDFIARIEPRLVKKSHAKICMESLAQNNTDEISWICGVIAPGLKLELHHQQNEPTDSEENARKHDIRCLNGELVYDATVEEDMVELSERYTGFRILTRSQLDGFMEGARCGFGHYKMYIPMLDFLCKDGFYSEAKQLFELWITNQPNEKEEYNTQLMGGMIYANLLELDKAIEWFKRITEKAESPLAYANMGKLYLIKGERNKAIEHLEMSKDTEGDIFLKKRILSIITNEEWRPLKLSLCMIVRDEEDQIGKALQSVDGLVDEIIVVDTGSKDKTKEIIKEFGGKLIESEWEDDFSQAKNLALSEATGDYILFMDADEFIHPTDRFGLALYKMLLPVERNIAFELKIVPAKEARKMSVAQSDILTDQKEDDYQIRVFPNRTGIEFRGKVFEDLHETLNEKQMQVSRNGVVKITHSTEGREKRDKRNIPAIAESFASISDPQKILKAGILFLRLGDLESAYPWLIKGAGVDPDLSAKIGTLYTKQNKPEMAKEILTSALRQFSDSSELILSMAGVYYREENYNEVINILTNRIEEIDKNLESEDASKAAYYHGISSLETGNLGDGIEYLAFAHEKNPDSMLFRTAGMYAFSKAEQWEEALQAAAQIAEEEEIDIPDTVNDFVDVGQLFMEMSRQLMKAGKTEEASICQKIAKDVIGTKISGEENIQRMSAVIEEMGEAQPL